MAVITVLLAVVASVLGLSTTAAAQSDPEPRWSESYATVGTADSSVLAVGSAVPLAGLNGSAGGFNGLNQPLITMATTPSGQGYWLAAADGGIFTYGDANFFGSTGDLVLNQPVVDMVASGSGQGYWMVAGDGGVFTYGDADFLGSMGGEPLNQPMVTMIPTGSGKGYWLFARDGGVFAFGDASFYGSLPGLGVSATIIDALARPQGDGYWLIDANGEVFAFGGAPALGSMADPSAGKITGGSVTASGNGYWLVTDRGRVVALGDAVFVGNGFPPEGQRVVGIAAMPDGAGYYIATTTGGFPPSAPPLPAGSGSGRRLVYSNSQQRVWLMEADGTLARTYLVSGRQGVPSPGTYAVYSKSRYACSVTCSASMEYMVRFAVSARGNGIGFHSIPYAGGRPLQDESELGEFRSAGCVRQAVPDAIFLWDWAGLGTTVVVTP